MDTKCNFCGNKNFIDTKVQYLYRHDNNFLIINGVPCEQCEYCGEQYFEGNVLRYIEEEFNNIYTKGKKPRTEIKVPIENFSDVQYA